MAQDTQNITIVGRLGQEPESKFANEGTQITTFSVACNNRDNTTTWYRVSAFGKLGEICLQYLNKGKQVFIAGDFTVRTYEKKDNGGTGVSYDIRATSMQMLGAKADNDGNATPADKPLPPRPQATHNAPKAVMTDEDLPF
jgi:single-strand DNA-binding protein